MASTSFNQKLILVFNWGSQFALLDGLASSGWGSFYGFSFPAAIIMFSGGELLSLQYRWKDLQLSFCILVMYCSFKCFD